MRVFAKSCHHNKLCSLFKKPLIGCFAWDKLLKINNIRGKNKKLFFAFVCVCDGDHFKLKCCAFIEKGEQKIFTQYSNWSRQSTQINNFNVFFSEIFFYIELLPSKIVSNISELCDLDFENEMEQFFLD